MPWEEFKTTIFLYWVHTNKDAAYQEFVRQNQNGPDTILQLLRRYGCRFDNNVWGNLAHAIENAAPDLGAVGDVYLRTADLNNDGLAQSVQELYGGFTGIRGVGPTTRAKLLHCLKPRFFVMWDEPIRQAYHNLGIGINDHPEGYLNFLRVMQQKANELTAEFNHTGLEVNHGSPESYLSTKLGYEPAKTMAKFLDEYNWMRYTKGLYAQDLDDRQIIVNF